MITGKEKLKKTLNHEEGPVLFDIGATAVTGIHCSVVEKLREYYGLEKKIVKIIEPYQMLGKLDDDLKDVMGIQTINLFSNIDMFGNKLSQGYKELKTHWGQTVLIEKSMETQLGSDGKLYVFPQGNRNFKPSAVMPQSGYFFDAINRVTDFDEDNYDVKDNLDEFGDISDETLEYFKNIVLDLDKTDKAVVASLGGTALGDIALVPGMGLLEPKGIRGVEEWYISTLIRQDEIHEIFDFQVKKAKQNLKKIHDIIGDRIDVAFTCGTDFGTQKSPFCSNETFRELYKPHYKEINDWIHTNTSWKTFKHSCGSIKVLLPDIIEAGFDVINPVQWTAENMKKNELKNEFGNNITFWGGGINTQKTLPFGTAKEVYDEAISCLKIFSENGGYVFNAIHNIQAMTPVENVVALANAVKDFNGER